MLALGKLKLSVFCLAFCDALQESYGREEGTAFNARRFGARAGSSSSSLKVKSIIAECCRLPLDERPMLDETDCSREGCIGVCIEVEMAGAL